MRKIKTILVFFIILLFGCACNIVRNNFIYFPGYHGNFKKIEKPLYQKAQQSVSANLNEDAYNFYGFDPYYNPLVTYPFYGYCDRQMHNNYHFGFGYYHSRPSYFIHDYWWAFDNVYWDCWWFYEYPHYHNFYNPYNDYYYVWSPYHPYPVQVIVIDNTGNYYLDEGTEVATPENKRRSFRRRSSSYSSDNAPIINPQSTTVVPELTPAATGTEVKENDNPTIKENSSSKTKKSKDKKDKKDKKKRFKKRGHS